MAILEKLFRLMAEKNASDIFVSAGAPMTMKINGSAMPVNPQVLSAEEAKRICYEILKPHQIEKFERELELNLSHPIAGVGNFRVNMMYQKGSVAAVVRYISTNIPAFDSLGVPNLLKQVIMEKRGLILVVGATGCGKSTTLAAMMDVRNMMKSGHILTFEDPIEFIFQSKKCIVNQREIGNDSHSFQDAMRNAMRQAPDLILVGEIRDVETMKSAMMYALSGHLCLATLHANNSYHALNRIINFFPLEQRAVLLSDLSVSLRCIISQRLVRNVEGGRLPAVEILMNTGNIVDLISEGRVPEIKEAMEKSMTPGSQTFEQDLFRLIQTGKISVQEGLANADSATNLSLLVGNSGMVDALAALSLPAKPGLGGPNFSEFKIK
ncbi:MAG TPA: type IV pili twitching motility protein PilT [Betaproteobacteria bacterium]|nr:type IV pili twitching motility protein PilT [Betaproteobacteria bacterium]